MNLLIFTQKVDKGDDNLGFFHEWVKKFAEKTETVFVIANFVGEHSLPANVHIYSMGKERQGGRLSRYTAFYKHVFTLVPKSDAVFVHMIPAWVLLLWPIAAIFRKKIYLWYTHKSVTLSLRVAEKLVEKIFTASKESCRLNSKKIVITGHGIDINRFAPKNISNNGNRLKLLSVGRITPIKNYKFLLDAVFRFKKERGDNFILDIVGGPTAGEDFFYKKQLEKSIEEKKIKNNVKFLGPKTYAEMPDIYNSHGILLHASETGSMDKAVLEAMACGLQIITTSEAFHSLLAARYVVFGKNINLFAEKIIQLKNTGKDLSLREIIIQNHNLDNLVKKIVKSL